MSDRKQRPPAGEPWVWLTRNLLRSPAWRGLSINGRRFVEFLLIEHMSKGGSKNGKLRAPHRQLQEFGIPGPYVAAAIREAEERGLVTCRRAGMRTATEFTIAWLPTSDGDPADNGWQGFRDPAQPQLPLMSVVQGKNLPNKGKADLPNKGKADASNLPNKSKADTPRNLPNKCKALLRNSYQDGAVDSEGEGARAALPAGSHGRRS